MSSDHLNELRRQRALAQQQLDWFDQEIARQEGTASGPVVNSVSNVPSAVTSAADFLIPEPNPVAAGQNARRGCLLYFFALVALLAALLVALYFWKYRDRPVLFAERETAEAGP